MYSVYSIESAGALWDGRSSQRIMGKAHPTRLEGPCFASQNTATRSKTQPSAGHPMRDLYSHSGSSLFRRVGKHYGSPGTTHSTANFAAGLAVSPGGCGERWRRVESGRVVSRGHAG